VSGAVCWQDCGAWYANGANLTMPSASGTVW